MAKKYKIEIADWIELSSTATNELTELHEEAAAEGQTEVAEASASASMIVSSTLGAVEPAAVTTEDLQAVQARLVAVEDALRTLVSHSSTMTPTSVLTSQSGRTASEDQC